MARPKTNAPPSVMAAVCALCGQDIKHGEKPRPRHGNWIHAGCHPGADDE